MEPEREIEKLLRAYVAKRRAAAGDPLKLHPATRRLLQGEAARHAPKPETEEVSFSFWQLFRQQWVFLLGFALMIFLGATLLLPGLSTAKRKAESVGAMNNLRQIGVAAQMAAEDNHGRLPASLDELANTLGTRAVLTDSISGKPFVYIAGGKDLKTLSSNAVLAYSPDNKNGRAVLFADGRVALVANGDFNGLMKQTPVEFALADKVTREDLAKTAVNAPAAAATPPPATLGAAATSSAEPTAAGELKEQEPAAGAMQLFVQTGAAANLQNEYRNVAVSAQAAPVLQSFQVLQNGNAVSVVDRDGSVYQGSVQVAAAERSQPAPVEAPPQIQTKSVPSVVNQQQQAVQYYFFRVTGMNRTLKQNVVFSGNVEAIPGVTTNATQTFGGGGSGGGITQNHQQISTNQQQLLSNSRVVGTAVIDRTNQIEINAVPVTP
ncbi:MAG TPA: hypothetical protein VN784_13675 [Candidatus Limnocylindrales bacterium]|nr:hypothetical protein [Candidatus Limnocylindrales bacterium]